ncbi:MAG: response regulator transcription factor [Oscillospiraceae bacterium]|nr:response regulator transcription factor [Oscillospiraceae bacterium]
MSGRILIIEDEKAIVDILKFNLEKNGYDTQAAYDGEEGLRLALEGGFDLLLLDLMLPKMDGIELCRQFREKDTQTPVVILTAREEEDDKVTGLEMGADDYITKPFSMRELMARIKANMRKRARQAQPEDSQDESLEVGELRLDPVGCEVYRSGNVVSLTAKEFDLLKFFMTQPDRTFSREELLEKVWNYEYYGDMRTVDVTVRRLREKIESDPAQPRYIVTKRGLGYMLKS